MSDNLSPALLQASSGPRGDPIAGIAIRTTHAASFAPACLAAALVVSVYHIARAPASNMVDGRRHALSPHLSLKLFVEAEDGALAGLVNIPGSASASLERLWDVAIESGDRGGSRCRGT